MKKFLFLGVAMAVALTAVSCHKKKQNQTEVEEPQQPKVTSVYTTQVEGGLAEVNLTPAFDDPYILFLTSVDSIQKYGSATEATRLINTLKVQIELAKIRDHVYAKLSDYCYQGKQTLSFGGLAVPHVRYNLLTAYIDTATSTLLRPVLENDELITGELPVASSNELQVSVDENLVISITASNNDPYFFSPLVNLQYYNSIALQNTDKEIVNMLIADLGGEIGLTALKQQCVDRGSQQLQPAAEIPAGEYVILVAGYSNGAASTEVAKAVLTITEAVPQGKRSITWYRP